MLSATCTLCVTVYYCVLLDVSSVTYSIWSQKVCRPNRARSKLQGGELFRNQTLIRPCGAIILCKSLGSMQIFGVLSTNLRRGYGRSKFNFCCLFHLDLFPSILNYVDLCRPDLSQSLRSNHMKSQGLNRWTLCVSIKKFGSIVIGSNADRQSRSSYMRRSTVLCLILWLMSAILWRSPRALASLLAGVSSCAPNSNGNRRIDTSKEFEMI